MLVAHTVVLFAVGGVSTAAAVTTDDNGTAILAGLLGTFADGLLAFGLFDVEAVTDSGVVSVGGYPPLALFALAGAVLAAFVALTGPLELLAEEADASRDDYGLTTDCGRRR